MMLRSASTSSLVSSLMGKQAAAPQVSCNIHATEIRRAQSAGNLEEMFNVAFHASASSLSRQSSKASRMNTIPSDHDYANWNGFCDVGFPGEGKMYLAAGIGVNAFGFLDEAGFGGGCGGGGGSCKTADDYRDGGDSRMENHYNNLLSQWPANPLLLRNYAHFLYKTKGDLVGAEEYYSRAILAEPDNGETLCGYGNVIWELHQDKERAQSYFERSLRASSGQSNICASYASFLWGLDDDDDIDVKQETSINRGIIASATHV